MKVYEVTIKGLIHNGRKTSLTLVNPANNKKDALKGFRSIASANGLNADWVKATDIKQRKFTGEL